MEYSEITDKINTLLGQQDWTNISGNLDKIVESSMGSAWGISQGKLYMCSLPCTGNWIIQDVSNVIDITADDTKIYVLYSDSTTFLKTKNGNGSGEWTNIPVNVDGGITNIFSSGSYIWGQGTKKWKLPKPGTTGNWMLSKDLSDTKITSASQNSLYGINSDGQAMKTDESLNSDWSLIPQFKGVLSGLISQDDSSLYGINSTNIEKCVGDNCSSLDFNGSTKNLSVNSNKNLWLTSENPGNLGNIYMKADTPIDIQQIRPLDIERDNDVTKLESDYTNSTYSQMMYKQLTEIKSMIENLFKDVEPQKKESTEQLEKVKFKLNTLHKGINIVWFILIIFALTILNYFLFISIL